MKPAAREIFGIAKRRGFWLRCFLGLIVQRGLAFAILVTAPSLAQTLCVGTPAECREAQEQLCRKEPAPPNLLVAKPARVRGVLLDETGAVVDFDKSVPESITLIQIRNPGIGEVLFSVPLREDGRFEFESVPAGEFRLIAVWFKDGEFRRLPLAEQPKVMTCSEAAECTVSAVIHFHGTDNPIDSCPPR